MSVLMEKKERWNTGAQVPLLLNGHSSMKERRGEPREGTAAANPIHSLISVSFILVPGTGAQ